MGPSHHVALFWKWGSSSSAAPGGPCALRTSPVTAPPALPGTPSPATTATFPHGAPHPERGADTWCLASSVSGSVLWVTGAALLAGGRTEAGWERPAWAPHPPQELLSLPLPFHPPLACLLALWTARWAGGLVPRLFGSLGEVYDLHAAMSTDLQYLAWRMFTCSPGQSSLGLRSGPLPALISRLRVPCPLLLSEFLPLAPCQASLVVRSVLIVTWTCGLSRVLLGSVGL